jgi:aminomethyltransferase
MDDDVLRTPLFDLHVELGAKMVPFAGYAMPVQYPLGVLKEHLHTRAAAGLFDVSHMGQIRVLGAQADVALESLVSADIVGLARGAQRYALFTNAAGGILDDLMVARIDEGLALVVNAACKAADLAHLRSAIGDRCEVIAREDLALLALQGPHAATVLESLGAHLAEMSFMQVREVQIGGFACLVSRSGYTGEDGFEISVAADDAQALARALLAHVDVQPIGLGARDSLRLEAGLCLYGHDLDEQVTPVEAALRWAIGPARRNAGVRAGGFPGADVVLAQLRDGVSRCRVGLRPQGRAPVREGAQLLCAAGEIVGHVTSGGFGPSVGHPVAMAYVDSAHAHLGCELNAEVRGRLLPVTVSALPFAAHQYKRAARP